MASLPEPESLLELKKQTESFEKSQVKGLAKQLESMFMSEGQIAKKIISLKSPNLKDDELNLLVYGRDLKKELGPKYKAWKSEKEKEKEIEEDEKKEPKNKKEKRIREKRTFKPLPKDSPVYDEVKKVKTDIKHLVLQWEEKGKSLGEEVAKFGILVGSTISAAAVIAAPVSFNVPGAITLVLTLLNAFSSLNTKILEFVPLISVVDKLRLVLPDDEVDKITKPMLGFVAIVVGISKTINSISKTLPSMSKAKQDALENLNGQINETDNQIKNLKPDDFESSAQYEAEKKRLEDRKKNLSDKASKLIA